MKSWSAQAPSNIALIKYMGKTESGNRPLNPSLSYTLSHLTSMVNLEEAKTTQWRPLSGFSGSFSDTSQKRFINHFLFLQDHWSIPGEYIIASGNNFPSDCGLASSASSFAALTLAAAQLAKERGQRNLDFESHSLSALSRKGSGSSCRSLFSPWALWDEEAASPMELPYAQLLHHVVVVSKEKKKVSSSEAHRQILTSPLNAGRGERATMRLESLLKAFKAEDWRAAYEICWAEFWDMHVLFETSQPHFGYMSEGSLRVLRWCEKVWNEIGDGPIVTMDAGPNVHLLFRPEQKDLAARLKGTFGEMVL